MKSFLFVFLWFLTVPAYAQDAPQIRTYSGETHQNQNAFSTPKKEKQRQPHVEIWLPPEFQSSEQKWPLLVFSHGLGGCARQSEFLTAALADKGYIVIAPDHEDAQCAGKGRTLSRLSQMRAGGRVETPEKPFRNPELWNDKTEADRRDDILFAVSSMLDDRQYKNYIDMDRIGLIGYSLGGHTVLGIAGGWPSWKDARFKAVAALSPYLGPYMKNRGIERIAIPVLYQGGTKDAQTPEIKRVGGAYARTRAPKYFLELEGANHDSWTELNRNYQDIIQANVLAFVDKHVKGSGGAVEMKQGGRVRTFWKDDGGADTNKAQNP